MRDAADRLEQALGVLGWVATYGWYILRPGQAKTRLNGRVLGVNHGAEEGTRTPDPLITNELLYH